MKQMSKYAQEVLDDVIQLLQDFCDASLATTTDLWSNKVQDSYISLTTSFVDRFFRLHR